MPIYPTRYPIVLNPLTYIIYLYSYIDSLIVNGNQAIDPELDKNIVLLNILIKNSRFEYITRSIC